MKKTAIRILAIGCFCASTMIYPSAGNAGIFEWVFGDRCSREVNGCYKTCDGQYDLQSGSSTLTGTSRLRLLRLCYLGCGDEYRECISNRAGVGRSK